ncbi:MAG TPA: flagellar hook-associated protein FlgL [Burkholderiaceae bacterium]
MRISSSMIYAAGSAQISDLQAQLLHTQEQIASGSSILTPADNPVNAAQALIVSQSQADNTQYAANRQSATNSLSQEETALASVTTLIQNAQTAIVDAGNGSYTLQQRQAIATSLQGSYNQLLGLANSQDGNGNYLFSGYQSGTAPFSVTSTGAQYNGDQGQTVVQVGTAQQIAIGDSGNAVFENNVTGNGRFTTVAGAVNIGSGIISSGSITNAAALTGDTYSVTFSGIQTSAGGANAGNGVISPATIANAAQLNGDTYNLNFHTGAGGTTYDVVDTNTGNTIVNGASYTAGQSLSVGGAQFNITGNPANGDQFTMVANPTTYTVADLTNPASATVPPPNQPYVAGQAIQFDGLQFDVTGAPSNGDTFSLAPSAKQSIFTTLTSLINLLNTPTGTGVAGETNLTNGLNTASNNLSSALNNILTVRASVGARLNEMTALNTEGNNLGLQYSTSLNSLQDLNYAQALSSYSQQQTTLTAAQQSFVKISNLSLFNYL